MNATEIYNELVYAYGVCAPSYPTVARWSHRFVEGREEVEDNPRIGRPITATSTTSNIQHQHQHQHQVILILFKALLMKTHQLPMIL